MKASLLLSAGILVMVQVAHSQQAALGSTTGTFSGSSPSTFSAAQGGAMGTVQPTTGIPQAGTSAVSPQNVGPLNAAPNGAGGTYGYPNAAIDPNTTNPGVPQVPYYVQPIPNNTTGTVSGTSTSINPAGAPFVTPPTTTAPSTYR